MRRSSAWVGGCVQAYDHSFVQIGYNQKCTCFRGIDPTHILIDTQRAPTGKRSHLRVDKCKYLLELRAGGHQSHACRICLDGIGLSDKSYSSTAAAKKGTTIVCDMRARRFRDKSIKSCTHTLSQTTHSLTYKHLHTHIHKHTYTQVLQTGSVPHVSGPLAWILIVSSLLPSSIFSLTTIPSSAWPLRYHALKFAPPDKSRQISASCASCQRQYSETGCRGALLTSIKGMI